MTVIACRKDETGAWVVAADTIVWNTAGCKVGTTRKIVRAAGLLIAACGYSSEILAVQNWLIGGGRKPQLDKDREFRAIVVDDSRVHLWGYDLRDEDGPEDTRPYYAIGWKCEFLMGCLAAGASAEQAVRLTLDHTDAGSGPVQVERFERAKGGGP